MSGERKKSNAALASVAAAKKASLLAQFDEIVRYGVNLGKGDEEEFINFLNRQEHARKLWVSDGVRSDYLQLPSLNQKSFPSFLQWKG